MLQGTYTAIVTPFNQDGNVDYDCFRALIERQIEGGVEGIVPVGTTGESPTLSFDEHHRVVETAVETVAGRVQVIAGTGANSTAEAVELTRHAQSAGADASLQVTPYYNKPNQEGLYRHFSTVADLGLPIVLYHVPGRTGREIEVPTVARLAAHGNVAAVKDAGGSVDRISAILDACDITVLSGDDSMTWPMMSVGARGVISVASNVAPRPVGDMVRAALAGDGTEALRLHRRYYGLFNVLFLDTNPIPVKAALAMMGLAEESYRLPLCETTPDTRDAVRDCLEKLEIL